MATTKKQMTKSQIAAHFAEKFELPRKTATAILVELACLATTETKKVGVFTIPGVGKLVKADRKARVGRNPATGEQINIPAKVVVKMRLAKACKEAIVPPKAAKKK
jgi:DNA-binding protein HU-beta